MAMSYTRFHVGLVLFRLPVYAVDDRCQCMLDHILELICSILADKAPLRMQELFEWVSKDKGRTAEFSHAMTGIAAQRAHVISGLDTSVASGDGDIIVDIGGARGALLPPLLGPRPSARGVVFDLPHVVAEAQGTLRAAVEGATASSNPSQDLAGDVAALLPVKDRVNFVAGNFFETDDVPKGGAAYLLALILHDWGDEDCVRILKNIANAMRDDGTIVICEMVRPQAVAHACPASSSACAFHQCAQP